MAKKSGSINEWELECTLVSRYAHLLPDLHASGYRLTRQALVVTRRLDLVAEKDDHTWIIELKKGSPDVEATTRQILDYKRCWEATYPGKPVSLMVISTVASEAKIAAFQRAGISYRSISEKAVLSALQDGLNTGLLGRCNSLPQTNDVDQIRFLLSKLEHVTVPEGMRYEPWCHASVYYALIRDNMLATDPWKKRISVRLFPQKPKCAILYHPEADVAHGDAFLHLNPRALSWPADGWHLEQLIERRVIEYRGCDRDGTGPSDFDSYAVKDWPVFATTVGLRGDSVSPSSAP